jgi:hypothetical protein
VPAYNSHFDAYSLDTLGWYSGPPYTNPIKKTQQLYLDVSDKDSIREVLLFGTIDKGASWVQITMAKARSFDPENPDLGGEYYGTFYPPDFGLTRWDRGTEVWYYVRCEDQNGTPGNYAYFPAAANPLYEEHTGKADNYLTFSVLPLYPVTYTGIKILLVDGYGRSTHDWTECLEHSDVEKDLEEIYGQTLVDAGYCYDVYDINGAGNNVHIHPLWFDQYDAVVWFTGPHFSNYLFDREAQQAIRSYLQGGGKVVLCGDRIAYNMADPGEGGLGYDSLGGEFLSGILGCDYLEEMPSPFAHPYVFVTDVPSVNVFGSPVSLDGDTLVLYRECPELKDMSYVVTNTSPPMGYTAQAVMTVTNPTPVGAADAVIYVECDSIGQCVFVNFDLCASINHWQQYCPGAAAKGLCFPPGGLPPGWWAGQKKLLLKILQKLLLLASGGSKGGGTAGAEPAGIRYGWELRQNVPNPCVTSTAIRYEVARPAHVRLQVYNTLGQVVRVLEDGRRQPGTYDVQWDGRNESGKHVSSGVYFYKIETERFTATRKLLVVR